MLKFLVGYDNEILGYDDAPIAVAGVGVVTNLVATKISNTQINLDSDAPDDAIGVVTYLTYVTKDGGATWTTLTNNTKAFSFVAGDTGFPSAIGTHALQFRRKAFDSGSSSPEYAYSNTVSITVSDTSSPTGVITSHTAGASVAGAAVVVSGTCADNIAVRSIQPRVDGANIGAPITGTNLTGFSKTFNTLELPDGNHVFSFILSDLAGNTTAVSITLNVHNALPPVAAFSIPATIKVGQRFSLENQTLYGKTYSINWGDGTTSSHFEEHFYSTAGAFTITLTATNDEGSDSESHTITAVTPKTAQNGYEILQTKGSFGCQESITHSRLVADYGDGYEQGALTGAKTGLKSWALKYNTLPGTLTELNPFFDSREISQADYLWDFYCRKRITGEPFIIESMRNRQYYLAKFADEKLSYELFAVRLFTTGIALQQRRIRNKSVFDTLKAPNLLRVYDPNKLTLNDGDAVTTYTDALSGVNLSASSNKPIYKTNIRNGNPVIRFSGTSNPLVSTEDLTIRHLFIVAKNSDSAYTGFTGLVADSVNDFLVLVGNSPYFYPLSEIIEDNGYPIEVYVNSLKTDIDHVPVPFNTWKLYELRFLTPYPAQSLIVGADKNQAVKWKGDIGDVIVGSKKILESDVWEIEEHLMKKWAIN